MLTAIREPGWYAGAVPLYAQLALQADRRSDAEIARVLGVAWHKVIHWRRNAVFCPLTGPGYSQG